MSIFQRLLGKAGKVDNEKAEAIIKDMLATNEQIVSTYRLVRDFVVFTNKRIIQIDIQGATGSKKEMQHLPYKSISRFSIETAGHGDVDSEIDLYISSATEPVLKIELGRNDEDLQEISRTLANELFN